MKIDIEMRSIMNIVVLCGGTSTERAVSLVTGEQVCKALRETGDNAILLDAFIGHESFDALKAFEDTNYTIASELDYIKEHSKDFETLKKSRKDFFGPNVLESCKKADIVFLALHGANGEDGRVQAAFDLMGIKYTGSDYLGSAMAMNKAVTKEMFKVQGVPVAESFSLKKNDLNKDIKKYGLEYPIVVKTNCGGSSIGVYIVHNDNEYNEALEKAFNLENQVVVERYIEGREFSVGVVDYKPLPIIEIIPKEGFYDYENKYKAGATIDKCPAELPKEVTERMQHAAYLAAKALGLSVYCRIDILTDKDYNCYCLEANTLPGMTPTSLLPQEAAVEGMSFQELCRHLIDVSLKKYN